MKNTTSLIIVLCLLVILGCKCQSDMFDSSKNSASPSPSGSPSASPSASTKPSASPASSDSPKTSGGGSSNDKLATGTYEGTGKNATSSKSGDFLLRIDSVDGSGNVEAYFEMSNGLSGSADMEGTIGSDGKLKLSGTLEDDRSVAISATVKGRTISGGFGIADSKLRTESGNFTINRR